MRTILSTIIALVVATSTLAAQDVITMRNGEELKVKVVEIGESQIKYRKAENPSGPIYAIPRTEVFVISFENGAREVITPLDAPAATSAATPAAAPSPSGGKYAQVDRTLKQKTEPIRDKYFYISPRLEYGYAGISSSTLSNANGSGMSVGATFEYLFDKTQPHGLGAGISYESYSLTSGDNVDIGLDYLGFDILYSFRPRGKFYMNGGFKILIPLKAEMGVRGLGSADAKTLSNTVFGVQIGAGVALGRFDVGGSILASYSDVFDVSDPSTGKQMDNRPSIFKLQLAYRF